MSLTIFIYFWKKRIPPITGASSRWAVKIIIYYSNYRWLCDDEVFWRIQVSTMEVTANI